MSGFSEQIRHVNELAERSEGFVWRYSGEYSPRSVGPPWDDPLLFFNLSVWRDFDSLIRFVNLDEHKAIMRNRSEWTKPAPVASAAMWWINDGVRPSIGEAIGALSSVSEHGDSVSAFSPRSEYCDLERWIEAVDGAGD